MLWTVAKVAYVRLRFLLLLAALGIVLGRWDQLRSWTDRARESLLGAADSPETISPDTEFFCPMCPGVVTRWPEKCPVCKMPLVRRKKGDPGIIPSGVTARMQLTPYQIQLAGIRTAAVTYQPLAAKIHAAGKFISSSASGKFAEVAVGSQDAPYVRVGQSSVVRLTNGDRHESWKAVVSELRSPSSKADAAGNEHAKAEVAGSIIAVLKSADETWAEDAESCVAIIEAPLSEREPFASVPHDPPKISAADVRQVHSCPDHTEYLFLQAGKCPFDDNDLAPKPLAADERLEWRCPVHQEIAAKAAGSTCDQCRGDKLLPRIVTYWPAGKVLAIPSTAVVHTGDASIVFVETAPSMFDGREVVLGPEENGVISVLSGVAAGEKVAVTGAFLLDAETRLNPAVASAYFGAGGATGSSATQSAVFSEAEFNFDRFDLSPRHRALASKQRVCPVTRLPLGSMGAPIPVELPDQTFYLCCEGCRGQLPERTQKAAESRPSP